MLTDLPKIVYNRGFCLDYDLTDPLIEKTIVGLWTWEYKLFSIIPNDNYFRISTSRRIVTWHGPGDDVTQFNPFIAKLVKAQLAINHFINELDNLNHHPNLNGLVKRTYMLNEEYDDGSAMIVTKHYYNEPPESDCCSMIHLLSCDMGITIGADNKLELLALKVISLALAKAITDAKQIQIALTAQA